MYVSRIKSRVLADEVAQVLKDALAHGHLQAGDRINEAEWAARLGVSRSPLREAIRQLAQDGLVVLTPHKGAFVPTLTPQDVREVYLLRSVLEGLAAVLVAETITEEEIAHLDDLVSAMGASSQSAERLRDLDMEFHEYLYLLSGHRRLIDVLAGLREQIRGFIRVNQAYSNLPDLVEEHREIVVALRRHDPSEARRVIEDHIVSAGHLMEPFPRDSDRTMNVKE